MATKGKTYEEIYGTKKAEELKEKRRKFFLNNSPAKLRKGKNYKEIYGNQADIEIKKRSKSKLNDKNPQWKGNNVGYNALHSWIKRNKPKPEFCEKCGKVPPYDLANISGEYKRDVNDFEWLCRKCHMHDDKRINNLKRGKNKRQTS